MATFPGRVLLCKVQMKFLVILACILIINLMCLLSPLHRGSVMAQGGPLVQNDFEDGTVQGWIPRGGSVSLTSTTEAAHAGTRSLKTTGRTANFHGPSKDLLSTLSPGTIYQITAWVRLVAGQPASTLRVTMQRTPTGGSNAFDTVASSPNNGVTDAAWVMLQGTYSFAGSVTGLLLYIESTDPTSQYYTDDFSIAVVPALGCSDPPDTSGIHTNFETGTAQGWVPRIGRETLTVTNADAHSGAFSLLTTGRQATFDGPAINAAGKFCNGSRYVVSLWAKLAPGQPGTQLRVSLQRTLSGTTTFHTVVGNTAVTADAWVRLRATYDFAFNYNSLTLYVESASGMPSFYIDDVDVTFVPPPVAEHDLASVYQHFSSNFAIGAAVWQGDLTGEHAFLLNRHFNSLTSENDMKWSSLQPTEGTFTYATADAQIAFARNNHMLARGHTLVWHNQNPAWLFNDLNGNPMTPTPENKALLLQRLENHIRAVMTHFGSDVYAWDVVNEVIDPSQPDGFRRSPWFNITGTDYIERAFHVAREVASNAKLYINDFDTTNPTKRQFLFNLVSDLKSRGVPIDGVGHQMHNNIDFPSAQSIIDTINMFWGLGLDNQITELDVSIYAGSQPNIYDDYTLIPQNVFIKQAYRYKLFFDAFRQLQGKISSVTFWGQADDHTWLTTPGRVNAPLLFDTSLKHKLAYTALFDPSQLPCIISSTSNITQANDSNQCGAVVNYNLPTVDASCGPVTCSPASGSFFPKGTTTVTCSTPVDSTSSFTVTVNDTQPPSLSVVANKTQSTDPGQCSAIVNYTPPVASDNCPNVGAVMCTPASGTVFQKGTTTVTCNVTDASGNSAGSSFTVTVNDTEAPTIGCSSNLTRVAAPSCPLATSLVVAYASPTATDNCPNVSTTCVPPSGSLFPLGTTTVTCTATDTSNNTRNCTFTVTVFNVGMQDDSNASTKLLINTNTGQYQFVCGGTLYTGTGMIRGNACTIVLTHNVGNRRLQASVEMAAGRGTATLELVGSGPPCRIIDRNLANNTF
jgi:endo-1,4-beta-xylanase